MYIFICIDNDDDDNLNDDLDNDPFITLLTLLFLFGTKENFDGKVFDEDLTNEMMIIRAELKATKIVS